MKRLFDLVAAGCGLLLLSPLFLMIMCAIKLSDGETVFYRQERVGRDGRLFSIWKFRSMRMEADKMGPNITRSGDSRVTRLGKVLRGSKLDELPQLLNVLAGDMSLVGPRPEIPGYVALYTKEQRRVLTLTPGITDLASLTFRHEEKLLAQAEDPERFYREVCLPRKITLNLEYAARASMISDIKVIFSTLAAIFRRS